MVKIFQEAIPKFNEALKKLTPTVLQAYENTAKIVVNLYEETLKFVVDLVNIALDKIKEYEEDIQVIVNATTEFLSGMFTLIFYNILKTYKKYS